MYDSCLRALSIAIKILGNPSSSHFVAVYVFLRFIQIFDIFSTLFLGEDSIMIFRVPLGLFPLSNENENWKSVPQHNRHAISIFPLFSFGVFSFRYFFSCTCWALFNMTLELKKSVSTSGGGECWWIRLGLKVITIAIPFSGGRTKFLSQKLMWKFAKILFSWVWGLAGKLKLFCELINFVIVKLSILASGIKLSCCSID